MSKSFLKMSQPFLIGARNALTNQQLYTNQARLLTTFKTRIEKDVLGPVVVPEASLWGPQTQRSLDNFKISDHEKIPIPVIRALGIVKLAAARVNSRFEKLSKTTAKAIEQAAQEVMDGKHDDQFPLVVWQTGSGTQSNMNANEVIANRAIQILGGELGTKMVHPNDHVNLGQSSNDTFPTAMHIAAAIEAKTRLFPSMELLEKTLHDLSSKFNDIIKTGRTHMQDATPLRLGQEFSAFKKMTEENSRFIKWTYSGLLELAQGGTAVGTGINSYKRFADDFANEVTEITGISFKSAENKFSALSSVTASVQFSSALASFATDLLKIANDIRLLSSGPRCGFGELILPANEPGSSIMPGKINPTQCEALSMVCAEVIGNNTTIQVASTHGHLQLNVFRPVVIFNLLRSIQLLGDACRSFTEHCLIGIEPNKANIQKHLSNSLMLVTALTPYVGYDKCAKIALHAHEKGLTLKEAALELGFVDSATFDKVVKPEAMLEPSDM